DGHDHAHILALAREHGVGGHLHGRAQAGHAKHRALLDAGRHLHLDAPPARQFDGAARPAVDLAEADHDRRLHVDWLRPGAPPRVAEDRAEDVPDPAAFAEEIFHILWRDGPVLDARAAFGAESSRATRAPVVGIDAGGLGRG